MNPNLFEIDISENMIEMVEDKKGKAHAVYSPVNARAAAEGYLQPITHNGTLYFFNPQTGLYEENKGQIESWFQTQFEDLICKGDLLTSTTLKPHINELMFQLLIVNPKTDYPFNQYNGIPVNNGVLEFNGEGFILTPYREEMMFTRKLPINYNPAADTAGIKQILEDWLEDDYPYLLQIPAQALMQSLPGMQPAKKAYMLVGEANAAKSTYLDLIRDFFGMGCCSKLSLQNLGARFSAVELVGKFVNLGDDLPDVSIGAFNTLKDLTGGRTHQVEEKHKKQYTADITAVHVYAANKPPGLSEVIDTDNAWWDRWIFLRFQNTFPKKPNWYRENITPNLEGFLLLVLDELVGILRHGGELQHLQPIDEVVDMWKHTSSPLLVFLDEETDRGRDNYIQKDELFAALTKWVEDIPDTLEREETAKRIPKTITGLSKSLIQLGIETATAGSRKNKIKVYRGIGWKPESQYRPRETRNSHL